MGKFVYALLMVFAIEASLFFFAGQDINNTSLFGMLLNFGSLESNSLYVNIGLVIGSLAVGGLIIGTFLNINIYAVYSIIAAILLTFALSITNLSRFLYSEFNALIPDFAVLATASITAPLLIFYIMGVMEWVRSNT